MKNFVIFFVLFVGAFASQSQIDTKESTKKVSEVNPKIAAGIPARRGEYSDFCSITVQFFNKQQTCGCFIWDPQHVVTSARCVRDCSEGDASNITVTIASATGATAIQSVDRIFIPDGTNGLEFLPPYEGDGIPNFRNIVPSNLAVLRLSRVMLVTERTPIQVANVSMAFNQSMWFEEHSLFRGWRFRACGIGVINNKGERARNVLCTDLNVQPQEQCKEDPTDERIFEVPTNQLCLHWPDRENNACVGDFGGPVYAYRTDPITQRFISQEVFCVLVGSPNARKNAPCLGGHIIFCEFIPGLPENPGNYGWIDAIARNLTPDVISP